MADVAATLQQLLPSLRVVALSSGAIIIIIVVIVFAFRVFVGPPDLFGNFGALCFYALLWSPVGPLGDPMGP